MGMCFMLTLSLGEAHECGLINCSVTSSTVTMHIMTMHIVRTCHDDDVQL